MSIIVPPEPMETNQVAVGPSISVNTQIQHLIESYCNVLAVNFPSVQSSVCDYEIGRKTIKAFRKLIFSIFKTFSKLPLDLVVMYCALITPPMVPVIPECFQPLQLIHEKLETNDDHELHLILEYHENNLKTRRTDSGTKSKRGRKPKQLPTKVEPLEPEELVDVKPPPAAVLNEIPNEETVGNLIEEPQRLATMAMKFIFANLLPLREMYTNAKSIAETQFVREVIDRKLRWIDIFQNGGNVSLEDMLNEYGPSDIFLREAYL